MKIQGNDIHLTQRELLTGALMFIKTMDAKAKQVPEHITVDDVYGLAAPVRIEGARHDYIISIKDEEAEPAVA